MQKWQVLFFDKRTAVLVPDLTVHNLDVDEARELADSNPSDYNHLNAVVRPEKEDTTSMKRVTFQIPLRRFAELAARDADGPNGADKAPAIDATTPVFDRQQQKAKHLSEMYGTTGRDAIYHGAVTGRFPNRFGKTAVMWDQVREAVERGENVLVAKAGGGFISIKHEEGQKFVFPNHACVPTTPAVFDDTALAAIELLQEGTRIVNPNHITSYATRKRWRDSVQELIADYKANRPHAVKPERKPDALGHAVINPENGQMTVGGIGSTITRAWWNFYGGFVRFTHDPGSYNEQAMRVFRRKKEEEGFTQRRVEIYFIDPVDSKHGV